jgi:hypothetical protein
MVFSDCCRSGFARLSRAAAKAAGERLRRMGLLPVRHDWAARAETCERCPMRVIERGVSYCGRPFLEKPHRDESVDGCGCPTHAKARDPSEHCPVDPRFRPARQANGQCTCKWCAAATERSERAARGAAAHATSRVISLTLLRC